VRVSEAPFRHHRVVNYAARNDVAPREQAPRRRGGRRPHRTGQHGDLGWRHDDSVQLSMPSEVAGLHDHHHSPTIAAALLDHAAVVFIVRRSALQATPPSPCGAAAAEPLRRSTPTSFFLGVTGVHPDAGLTTPIRMRRR